MATPNFAPLPRSFVQALPTATITYKGYEYWCEGFKTPDSYEGGYRYKVRRAGTTETPATSDQPFDMVTKAGMAVRAAIDRLPRESVEKLMEEAEPEAVEAAQPPAEKKTRERKQKVKTEPKEEPAS